MPTDETAEPEPEPASEPPAEPEAAPEPAPPRPPYRLLAIAAVVAVIVTATTYFVTRDDDPVAVVENFFAAIADKDVDTALTYVGRIGYGVPFGERAAFLHPDAIADGWRLLDAEFDGGPGGDYVDVTIGDDETSTSGRLEVTDFGGEWNIVDPFIEIEVSAPAYTYIAVNERRVVTADLYRHDITGYYRNRMELLPGRYTFWGDTPGSTSTPEAPVDLLPAGTYLPEPLKVSAPTVVPTPDVLAAVQTQADAIIDDCATFAVPNPEGCPFGLGDRFEAGDDTMREIRDVTWEIVDRPVLAVDGSIGGDPATGMAVTVTRPGLITLTARGLKGFKDDVRFRAECTIDGAFLRAALRPDGTPEVYAMPDLGPFGLPTGTTAATCRYQGEV